MVDVSEVDAQVSALRLADDVIARELEDAVSDAAQVAVVAVRNAARTHRRSGELERGIRVVEDRHAGGSSVAKVASTAPITGVIVGGARPHVIAAMRGHALPIAGAGPVSGFASKVRHPGSTGDPFVARAATGSRQDIERIATDGAADAARTIAAAMEG